MAMSKVMASPSSRSSSEDVVSGNSGRGEIGSEVEGDREPLNRSSGQGEVESDCEPLLTLSFPITLLARANWYY
jgi:hypothetical protein